MWDCRSFPQERKAEIPVAKEHQATFVKGIRSIPQERKSKVLSMGELQVNITVGYSLHPIQQQGGPQRITASIVSKVSTLFAHKLHTKMERRLDLNEKKYKKLTHSEICCRCRRSRRDLNSQPHGL